jgi:hypothetical protein
MRPSVWQTSQLINLVIECLSCSLSGTRDNLARSFIDQDKFYQRLLLWAVETCLADAANGIFAFDRRSTGGARTMRPDGEYEIVSI